MARIWSTVWIDQLGERLARLAHEIGVGLEALHRVQFDEPWKPARRPTYGEW